MTFFSCDVETTGLNPFKHDVTSLSVVEVFTEEAFTCQLTELYVGWNWDPKTLEWAKENIPQSVAKYPTYTPIVACEFIERLMQPFEPPYTFVAWPASFDYPFMQTVYNRARLDSMPFHYRTVDVKSWMCGQYGVPIEYNRDQINEAVGFELWTDPKNPHDPYCDALEQARVFRRMLEDKG